MQKVSFPPEDEFNIMNKRDMVFKKKGWISFTDFIPCDSKLQRFQEKKNKESKYPGDEETRLQSENGWFKEYYMSCRA